MGLLVFFRLLGMEDALPVVPVEGIPTTNVGVIAGRHNANEVIGEKKYPVLVRRVSR